MFLPVSKTAALVQSGLGAVRALADKSPATHQFRPQFTAAGSASAELRGK
jgi:hypothetical protein